MGGILENTMGIRFMSRRQHVSTRTTSPLIISSALRDGVSLGRPIRRARGPGVRSMRLGEGWSFALQGNRGPRPAGARIYSREHGEAICAASHAPKM
jgi:hypothetical protein